MRMTVAKTILDRRDGEGTEANTTAQALGSSPTAPARRRLATILCLGAYLALGFVANLPVWLHGPSTVTICGGCGARPGGLVPCIGCARRGQREQSACHELDQLSVGCQFDGQHRHAPRRACRGADHALVRARAGLQRALHGGVRRLRRGGLLRASPLCLLDSRSFRRWSALRVLALHGRTGARAPLLLLAVLPPLMLICLDEIVVRRRQRWWLAGGALGLLAACQMLVSTELLAIFTLMAVIGLAIVAVASRDSLRSGGRHVRRGVGRRARSVRSDLCLPALHDGVRA